MHPPPTGRRCVQAASRALQHGVWLALHRLMGHCAVAAGWASCVLGLLLCRGLATDLVAAWGPPLLAAMSSLLAAHVALLLVGSALQPRPYLGSGAPPAAGTRAQTAPNALRSGW